MIVDEVLFDYKADSKHIDIIDSMSEIKEWCEKNFGPQAEFSDMVSEQYPWTCRIQFGFIRFQFAREQDALLFRLRWS